MEAREKRQGGRESLTHLAYVATVNDSADAERFHEKVMAATISIGEIYSFMNNYQTRVWVLLCEF